VPVHLTCARHRTFPRVRDAWLHGGSLSAWIGKSAVGGADSAFRSGAPEEIRTPDPQIRSLKVRRPCARAAVMCSTESLAHHGWHGAQGRGLALERRRVPGSPLRGGRQAPETRPCGAPAGASALRRRRRNAGPSAPGGDSSAEWRHGEKRGASAPTGTLMHRDRAARRRGGLPYIVFRHESPGCCFDSAKEISHPHDRRL
jgi:hypothetical protein